ncbi:MAG: class I SAM-dependent methyltransferase [Rhizobiaceae bacterium]|nr:class I SAM-dependent methyltransferase [Rhizobiaceae bacterium]
MTELERRIAELIAASGPMSVADYMVMCLFDPRAGYYTTREPFGRAGDFVTAPEISQMFGELVAVWLYSRWKDAGTPKDAVIAEIGPGRGTMMRDMARTFRQIDPAFCEAARFALIETSERLRKVQQETLAGAGIEFSWHDSVESLPDGPPFIVGNELFDAVPIRQFVKTAQGWRERVVGLGKQEELVFLAGASGIDTALLPPDAATAGEGAIVELAPVREAMMEAICARVAGSGGAGLFIDYGYLEPAVGDTLQALREHKYDDVLAHPGEADITAHVDFARLRAVAERYDLQAELTSQGKFLLDQGLLERAGRLGAALDEAGRQTIREAVERLAAPDQMGELFKVLAVTSPPAPDASGLT